MKNPFTVHPHSMGESYWKHFFFASLFGCSMLIAGVACILHAIFPFIFKTTGSNMLIRQMKHFVDRMPIVEERIVDVSRSIERKMGTHQGQASPFSVSLMKMQYESVETE
jgi:hypothetical protein